MPKIRQEKIWGNMYVTDGGGGVGLVIMPIMDIL